MRIMIVILCIMVIQGIIILGILILLILLLCIGFILVARIYQLFRLVIILKASQEGYTRWSDMGLPVVQSTPLELHKSWSLYNAQSNLAYVHVTHENSQTACQ